MVKIIIIGNGTFSVMLSRYIEMTTDWEVCAFAVDEYCIEERVLNGIDVISIEEMKDRYDVSSVKLIMGIGYAKMGSIKERLFKVCTSMGYEFENYIHPTAIISSDAKLGVGNVILEGAIIEQGVELGNANLIYCGSMITHETFVGDFNSFSAKVAIAGNVKIGNNNYFGLGSAVKDHLELGNNIMVGAMAYCHRHVKDNTLIVPPKSSIMEGREGMADSISMFA
ncbi:MAG: hypothetical protein NC489_20610 [Ruminococcus flavefaciens]|nr:hypothetical protein [Ruminococcus flavefaciens]